LPANNFNLVELTPNGGWYDSIAQELWRLPFMGRNYSGSRGLGFCALFLSLPALAALRLLRAFDRRSSEVLTFGWHVVAVKK
jgi:hypothetical protein